MQPMVGGSVVLGGGRVLGKKEDYENDNQGKIFPSNKEVVSRQMIVPFWRGKEAPLQDTVTIELMQDLRLFGTSHYEGDRDTQAQLKLSRLVQYPNVIWSLLYHALIKNTVQSLDFVEGGSCNKYFDFTATDAFVMLFPGYDWTLLEKKQKMSSEKSQGKHEATND